ncbi:MAG: hypothetical protein AAGK37_07355 [Pseudomonadota bacterium]
MSDPFINRARRPSDPAVSIFAIAPDDTSDLPRTTTAINVETPGRLRVTMLDGSVGTLSARTGEALPVRVSRVWLTGTTATGITGLA